MRGTRNSKLTKDFPHENFPSKAFTSAPYKIALSKTSAESSSRASITVGPISRDSIVQSEAEHHSANQHQSQVKNKFSLLLQPGEHHRVVSSQTPFETSHLFSESQHPPTLSMPSDQSYATSIAGVTTSHQGQTLIRDDLIDGERYAQIIDSLQSQVNILQAQMAIRDEESAQ